MTTPIVAIGIALALGIPALFLAIALGCQAAPVSTNATIRTKSFVEASSYRPAASGPPDRSFRTNAPITQAAHYLFDLDPDTPAPVPLKAYRNQPAGEKFQVGQRVSITYQVKSIPLFFKKAYVTEMEPLEATPAAAP